MGPSPRWLAGAPLLSEGWPGMHRQLSSGARLLLHSPANRPRASPGSLVIAGSGVLGALIASLCFWISRDADIELVRSIRDLASSTFVSELDGPKLVDDALRGMIGGLDRYSHYYPPVEIARLDRETSGEF